MTTCLASASKYFFAMMGTMNHEAKDVDWMRITPRTWSGRSQAGGGVDEDGGETGTESSGVDGVDGVGAGSAVGTDAERSASRGRGCVLAEV